MKSKKWLWVTLTILLTLVVLVVVAGAAFRMGATQSARLVQAGGGVTVQGLPFSHMRSFEQNQNGQPGFDQQGYAPRMMQGFDQGYAPRMMHGFGRGGFERGHGGFFSPIFGLVKLAILAGLLWLGYKLIKNSGWKLVRMEATSESTPEDGKKE